MGIYYLPCVFCRREADEFSYMSLHPWIGICLFHNIVLFFLFWRRLFCGELGSREKTNNAQMIKGNRQGQAGSLFLYQCGEIVTDVFWGRGGGIIRKMKCPERWCKKRACDIGETGSGWIIVSLKCPNCGRVVKVYWKPKGKR